jgi:hypothetical protein
MLSIAIHVEQLLGCRTLGRRCTWTSIINFYDSRYTNVLCFTNFHGAIDSVVIIGLLVPARPRPGEYEVIMKSPLSEFCQSRKLSHSRRMLGSS